MYLNACTPGDIIVNDSGLDPDINQNYRYNEIIITMLALFTFPFPSILPAPTCASISYQLRLHIT